MGVKRQAALSEKVGLEDSTLVHTAVTLPVVYSFSFFLSFFFFLFDRSLCVNYTAMRFRVSASLGFRWLRFELRPSGDSRQLPTWLLLPFPSCPVSWHLRRHLTLFNANSCWELDPSSPFWKVPQ